MKGKGLPLLIPLVACAMTAGIGIPIGYSFLEIHEQWSEDVTLIAAVSLTAAIMAGATFLSWRTSKLPPEPAAPRQPTRSRAVEPETGVRRPRTEQPSRGARRGNDRRRSR